MKKLMSMLMSAMILAALMAAMVVPAGAVPPPERVSYPAETEASEPAVDQPIDLPYPIAPEEPTYPETGLELPPSGALSGYSEASPKMYQFATATKLWILAHNIFPLNYADEALDKLMTFNDPEALKELTFSGQTKSIWEMLPADVQAMAPKMTTYQLLTYVKTTVAYASNADLHKYVNLYLQYPLSGDWLRNTLNPLGYDESLADLNANDLIIAVSDILSRPEVRALIDSMEPLRYYSMYESAYAKIEPERLEEIYAGVRDAAKAVWPEMVQNLEQFRFMAPVEYKEAAD